MESPSAGTETSGTQATELAAEQRAVDHIRGVHAKHVEQARATAARLGAEAAEATEDGIRDIVDEDGEADTAIRAAIVRQTATSAMQAFRRVTDLQNAGDALAFGRIDCDAAPDANDEAGERLYIGRRSVIDGDDALLVDWRAGAAAPFYQATPIDRRGVTHRRHLMYGDGVSADANELIGYADEVFDLDATTDDTRASLRGEAAILAALVAPSESQMKSVVATIQAEQDRIIRAPSKGALVVQGGPGTGKTVVALHRAAYLLYNQRAALAENGVLIVGPTDEFLAYISGVLPSLGESGVVSVTANQLFGGVRIGRREPDEVATLKGRIEMAALLGKAVHDRQRPPSEDFVTWYGSDRVKLPVDDVRQLFDAARRHRTHNDGADALRTSLIEALVAKVWNSSFGDYEEAFRSFAGSRDIRMFLLRHWPTLTPEQALNDLFGSPALLRLAAIGSGLSTDEIALLSRDRATEAALPDVQWSEGDIPLLDELQDLLGTVGENRDSQRIRERDEENEFMLAEQRDALGLDDDADEDQEDKHLEGANDAEPNGKSSSVTDALLAEFLKKRNPPSTSKPRRRRSKTKVGDASEAGRELDDPVIDDLRTGRVWGHDLG